MNTFLNQIKEEKDIFDIKSAEMQKNIDSFCSGDYDSLSIPIRTIKKNMTLKEIGIYTLMINKKSHQVYRKEYYQRPEVKARTREYLREYRQRKREELKNAP